MESLVLGYLAGKLQQTAEGLFVKHVVSRWKRRRAERFFNSFCRAIEEQRAADTLEHLEGLFEDEVRSGVLFDAYRSVCTARSREIGPRVIALLTAEVVTRDGVANVEEELLFAAGEELADGDFLEFAEYVRESLVRAENEADQTCAFNYGGRGICRVLHKDTEDSNWTGRVSTGPLNLATMLGPWASRLELLGIVETTQSQESEHYHADSERHIDQAGVITTHVWALNFDSTAIKLAELVSIAQRDERESDSSESIQ